MEKTMISSIGRFSTFSMSKICSTSSPTSWPYLRRGTRHSIVVTKMPMQTGLRGIGVRALPC
ncbi:hypothetical protein ACSBR2_015204 [Camellia fascicularis]